jgi:hypothetical protein
MKQQPRFSSAPVRNRVPRPPGRAAQFVTDRVVLLAQQQENSPDWRVGTGDVRLDKRVRQRGGRAPLADKWSLTRGSWPGSRGGGSRDQDATGAATDSGGRTARTWPVSQSMAALKSGRPAGMTGSNAPPPPTHPKVPVPELATGDPGHSGRGMPLVPVVIVGLGAAERPHPFRGDHSPAMDSGAAGRRLWLGGQFELKPGKLRKQARRKDC